jgi:hypothetical protein
MIRTFADEDDLEKAIPSAVGAIDNKPRLTNVYVGPLV